MQTPSKDNSSFYPENLLYPKLSDEMVRRSAPYGVVHDFGEESEIHRWVQDVGIFLIVLEGELVMTSSTALDGDVIVRRHHDAEFAGNTYLLTEREMLVGLSATPGTRTLSIPHKDFRRYLTGEPDIADVILPAFMYRCMSLVAQMRGGAVIVGSRFSSDTLRIQRFLAGNRHPNQLLDPEVDPEAEGLLAAMKITTQEFPVVISGSTILLNPDNVTLAESLGLFESVAVETVFDVAIVGAGPAGLAAAVYAASEGLRTVVVEGESPGGQAGTSSRIENYLGFPSGISGAELAGLAQAQAQKFGAKLVVSRNVMAVNCANHPFVLCLESGGSIKANSVIVATGARYRKLKLPNLQQFEMDGIHYLATSIEARLCRDQEVIVVGGGNSAGQAAMFLSAHASHVHILIRGNELAASMSDYLASRILSSKRITLHRASEIIGLEGDKQLLAVTWRCFTSGEEINKPIHNVFVMIGADPCTEFLSRKVSLDANRFVLTGAAASPDESQYGTSVPGIFAVGDARSGSTKRVASTVGEGSVAVAAVHQYLATTAQLGQVEQKESHAR